jgi:RimJ/RimL family protein N-acetyltransferase
MIDSEAWPVAQVVVTARLRLEPLHAGHAAEAVTVFDDIRLHEWIGGVPASLDELAAQYRRQSVGHSPDGKNGWLNWILRRLSDDQLIGTVQATLYRPEPHQLKAELAWVIGTEYQNKGYGREGALAMSGWLKVHGVTGLAAHIHPGHDASTVIARTLGLAATDIMHDGEVLWSDSAGPSVSS